MASFNPFSIEGKTILVTGAAGGIGSEVVRCCASLGANIIATDINADGLKNIVAQLPTSEKPHKAITADLTSQNDIEQLVGQLEKIDGFVCNAGVMKLTPVQFITDEELSRIQSINLNAPILLTRALLKKKKFNKGASIVFTASAAGIYRVSPGNAIYATTKCGIDAFMRTVALEFGPKGIRCNSVNPGMVETPLIGNFTEEEKAREVQNYPLRRFAQPRDVALGILYLLSDASSFVTGTALKIDGGMTLS